MKNTNYFLIFMIIVLFSCRKGENNSTNLEKNKKYNNLEITSRSKTSFDFLPTSTSNQIIHHEFYSLSYVEKQEQAEWVAYQLRSEMIKSIKFDRPFFIEDPLVKTNSADWRNYKKSGFDKGHLCPAADMKFSKKAFEDTFFTSNISPQKHDFNDGIWNTLESKVRYWAEKYGSIYVVTGGVLTNNLDHIGKENVAVPKFFYKVLLDTSRSEYKMIAFLVPSEKSDKPLYDFVISVDELEKMTRIDFYPNLPDEIESRLEKKSDYKDWSF
jgi:endonuclease G, mitochondrial